MRSDRYNPARGRSSGFTHSGIGQAMTFRCGKCDKPNSTTGSAMRFIRGLRTKVCAACKTDLDANALPVIKLLPAKRVRGKRVYCATIATGSALVNVTALEARAFIEALELAILKRGDPE